MKKGLLPFVLTTELVAVRSTNCEAEKSSQMDVSGEKMPWLLVEGDMRTGVSRMVESRVALSSKEKAEGFRSREWKSM